jgi:hypothetical protein
MVSGAVLIAFGLLGCGGGHDQGAASERYAASLVAAAPASLTPGDYQDVIQRIFVGYFGRPADPAGLAYWAEQFNAAKLPSDLPSLVRAYATNPEARAFVDAFGTSQESLDLYGGDNDAFVTSIYRNIFGRDPDVVGKAYWVDAINKGVMSRAIAALTIMNGAQGTDVAVISKKVNAAQSFTASLVTEPQKSAYGGLAANAEVRAMLGKVLADTDAGTSGTLIENTIKALLVRTTASSRYLYFYDASVAGISRIGMVEPRSGQVVQAFSGTDASLTDILAEFVLSDTALSNVHARILLAWSNQRLMRQDLVASEGIPTSTQVSSISASDVCSWSSSVHVDGDDTVNAYMSWRIFRSAGTDAKCDTNDDNFLAVRMNMGPADRPITVPEPISAIHGPSNELIGWLVRNGRTVSRVNANFENPVEMFSLPADDITFSYPPPFQPNTFFFVSGGALYAWDAASPKAGVPTLVTRLVDEHVTSFVAIDPRDVFILIRGRGTFARIVRFNFPSKNVIQLGTLGNEDIPSAASLYFLSLTPTRVVITGNGEIATFDRATNGQSRVDIRPPNFSAVGAVRVITAGEKIWLSYLDSRLVLIINSDGSEPRVLNNAIMAGDCFLKSSINLATGGGACEAMLVVENGTIRAYGATDANVRAVYGTIAASTAMVSLNFPAHWGEDAVLTLSSDWRNPGPREQSSFLLRSGQPTIQPLSLH